MYFEMKQICEYLFVYVLIVLHRRQMFSFFE